MNLTDCPPPKKRRVGLLGRSWRRTFTWLPVACILVSMAQAQWTPQGGGSHKDPETGLPLPWKPKHGEVVSGHHYDIAEFRIEEGITVMVTNWLVVDCVWAVVGGSLDGNSRGWEGGRGGGGGGGADQDFPGSGGTPGGAPGISKTGGAGGAGETGAGPLGGRGGAGGRGSGAPGGPGQSALGAMSDTVGGIIAQQLSQFDAPQEYGWLIGSGGGGGGGGSGGHSENTNSGGGGGGGGAGGGPGGAMIQIKAVQDIQITGSVSTVGGAGSKADHGGPGTGYIAIGSVSRAGVGGNGGVGNAGDGASGIGGVGGTDTYGVFKGEKAGNGGNGGAGGYGAGGCVRLKAERSVVVTGQIDARSPAGPASHGIIYIQAETPISISPLLGRAIVVDGQAGFSLSKPQATKQGTLSFNVLGIHHLFVIEFSPDLMNWTTVATNLGSSIIEVPLLKPNGSGFYRATTP